MTPEERATDLTKWVAADLRPRQWVVIRDSIVEAIAEEREACARAAEEAAAGYSGSAGDLKAVSAYIASAIRAHGAQPCLSLFLSSAGLRPGRGGWTNRLSWE